MQIDLPKQMQKTYAIHAGSTSWIHRVQRRVASNNRTQIGIAQYNRIKTAPQKHYTRQNNIKTSLQTTQHKTDVMY